MTNTSKTDDATGCFLVALTLLLVIVAGTMWGLVYGNWILLIVGPLAIIGGAWGLAMGTAVETEVKKVVDRTAPARELRKREHEAAMRERELLLELRERELERVKKELDRHREA